jgi:hypothetical protein
MNEKLQNLPLVLLWLGAVMWTGHHHGEGERLTLDDFNVVKRVVKHWERVSAERAARSHHGELELKRLPVVAESAVGSLTEADAGVAVTAGCTRPSGTRPTDPPGGFNEFRIRSRDPHHAGRLLPHLALAAFFALALR